MIPAIVVAVTLGLLAAYSLIGREVTSDLARGFLVALPLVAASAAGLSGLTLPWAIGIVLALLVGLLAGPVVVRDRRGPFAAAVGMMVGLLMAVAMVRWLVPIVADLTGLSAWTLAIAVIAAGACWMAGDRWTLSRTGLWLSVATVAVLFAAGIALGAPGTLADPLLDVEQKLLPGILWLVVVSLFGMFNPAPERRPGSSILTASLALLGLVGLLSLLGGFLVLPSLGLISVAGYASSGGAIAGTVVAIPLVLVAAVATGAAMKSSLRVWEGYSAPRPLQTPGRRVTAVAVLVGLLAFSPAPTWLLVGATAIVGLVALVADRRHADAPVEHSVG